MAKDSDSEGTAAPSVEERIREAELDRALAPYTWMLTPEVLAYCRDVLEDMLATHPVAIRAMRRLKPAPVVQQSHKMAIMDGSNESGSEAGGTKRERSGT